MFFDLNKISAIMCAQYS